MRRVAAQPGPERQAIRYYASLFGALDEESLSQWVKVGLRTVGGDLVNSQLPYLWLPALRPNEVALARARAMEQLKQLRSLGMLELDAEVEAVVTDSFELSGFFYQLGRQRTGAQIVRTLMAAAIMTYLGINPEVEMAKELALISHRLHSQQAAVEISSTMQELENRFHLDPRGKAITVLVERRLFAERWNSSAQIFWESDFRRELRQRAAQVHLVPYDHSEGFLKAVNEADGDWIIVETHNALELSGTGDLWVGDAALSHLPPLTGKRLQPGGAILFLSCGVASHFQRPANPLEEPWIAFANQKLSPQGGVAIAATDYMIDVSLPTGAEWVLARDQALLGPAVLLTSMIVPVRGAIDIKFGMPRGLRAFNPTSQRVTLYPLDAKGRIESEIPE